MSQAESERVVSRDQHRFDAGVYGDVPASTIHDNALAELKNFRNWGRHLAGRTGSKLHSNTALPTVEDRGPYSATKSGAVVTLSTGDITEADIGSKVWWSDTLTYERIKSVTSTTVFTVNTTATHSSVSDMTLTGAHNGSQFHKEKSKVIHHIHDQVYITDYDLDTYTKCIRNSIITPDRFKTVKDEFHNFTYIFSNKGVFKVDLEYGTPVYYPLNSPIPSVKITDSGTKSRTNPYGYRYIYTMSRLSGTGSRDRNTEGVSIELESGGVKFSKTEFDYGEMWQDADIDDSNSLIVGDFTCPTDSVTGKPHTHWTHYSVYRTLNIGQSGVDGITGSPNSTDLYIWVTDIPVVKPFTCSQSGTTATATVGSFSQADIGNTLEYADGRSTTITVLLRSNEVTVADSMTVSSQSAVIGNSSPLTGYQSGTTVSRTGGRTFAASDVGKTIFWADGRSCIITEWINISQVVVHKSQTVTSQAFTLDPVSRKFHDTYTDDSVRIFAGAWTLFSRLYDRLPSTNLGLVVPGFMFTAQTNGNKVYYSAMEKDFEYLTGYYHPLKQFIHIKGSIQSLQELPDKLIIYCKTSTHEVPLNNFQVEELSEVGVSITTIIGQNVVDPDIGVADAGSIRDTGHGEQHLVTSDYAIRRFDGQKYSDNIIADRIMDQTLKMQPAFASSYEEENGYMLSGRQP